MNTTIHDSQLKTQPLDFTIQAQAGNFPSRMIHKIWETVKFVFSFMLAVPLYPLNYTGLLSGERYTKITGFNAQKTTDFETPLANNTEHITTPENDSLENKALCQSETEQQASLSENIEKQSKLCESIEKVGNIKNITTSISSTFAAFFANTLVNNYYSLGWIEESTRMVLTTSIISLLAIYLFLPFKQMPNTKLTGPSSAATSENLEKLSPKQTSITIETQKKPLTEDIAKQAKIYEIMLKTKNDIKEAYSTCTNFVAGSASVLALAAAAKQGAVTNTTGLVLSGLIVLAWASHEVARKIPFLNPLLYKS